MSCFAWLCVGARVHRAKYATNVLTCFSFFSFLFFSFLFFLSFFLSFFFLFGGCFFLSLFFSIINKVDLEEKGEEFDELAATLRKVATSRLPKKEVSYVVANKEDVSSIAERFKVSRSW